MNDTRKKILEAMYTLIAKHGYDKTSIGKICEEINIKKPSVYYYFKNKEEILLEMIDSNLNECFDEIKTILAHKSKKSYKDALIEYGNSYADYLSDDREYINFEAEMHILSIRNASVKEKFAAFDKKNILMIERLFTRGVELGVFKKSTDVRACAEMVLTVIEGIRNATVFKMPVDVKSVWSNFLENLFVSELKK